MKQMRKKAEIKAAHIPVLFLKEGTMFVCYTPAFDLAASGNTLEEAQESFAQACSLILDEVAKTGRLEEMLQGYGWSKVRNHWSPPRLIGQESKEIPIPAYV